MSAFKRLIWLGHDRKLPTEIYTSLVASLFSDPRTLIIGGFGSITAALVIAWRTAEPTLIFCAIGLIAITLARAWDMHAFARRAEITMTRAAAVRWELRYVAGASAYVALLGAWWLVYMRSRLTLHRSRFRRGRTFHLLLARRISRAFHLLFARLVSRTRGLYRLIRTRCRS